MLKIQAIGLMFAVATVQAASLTAPEKSLDGRFWDNSYQPLGIYQNGFFLFRDQGGVVRMFDQQGQKVLDKKIQSPDIVVTRVSGMARSASGQTALSVSTSTHQAIIWLNPAGEPARIVRTPGYGVGQIVFSQDGSLWTTGRGYAESGDELPEYDVIRRYDAGGKQIGSYLPRSTFEKKRNDPASEGLLAASGGNVVFYSPDYGDLAELDESGRIVKRVKYAPAAQGKTMYRMALTKTGKLVFSIVGKGEHRELYSYDLNTDQGTLLDAAKVFDNDKQGAYIMGSEGDQIVLQRSPWPTYQWVRVE